MLLVCSIPLHSNHAFHSIIGKEKNLLISTLLDSQLGLCNKKQINKRKTNKFINMFISYIHMGEAQECGAQRDG